MKILVDSDFLVGLFREGDPHYDNTHKMLVHAKKKRDDLLVLKLVLFESATVLSNRVGMDAAKLFYNKYPDLEMIQIDFDSNLENLSWQIFLDQTKKGTSFVDCANLAALEYYKLDRIFSFDTFYPKKLLSFQS